MSLDSCTRAVTHSRIKVEENKRKAIFRNPQNDVYKVSVIDGCLVKDGVRSDFLVSKPDTASVIVELKGTDVEHACDQLFASAEHPNVAGLLENRLGFMVVCSRYPRFDAFVARAKQRAAKRYKAGFHVITKEGEFDIERAAAIDGPY